MTITIPGQNIKMDTESGIDPVWYDKLKALISVANFFDSGPSGSSNRASTALVASVALSNTSLFFDGPSISLGSTGTWFVSGSVTCGDATVAATYFALLWDGTAIISSGMSTTASAGSFINIALSGFITSPSSNVKISVKGITGVNGFMLANASGAARDSTISAFRIA